MQRGRKGYTVDDYRKCAEMGMTQAETARALGVSKTTVREISQRHNFRFVPGKKPGRPIGAKDKQPRMWRDSKIDALSRIIADLEALPETSRSKYRMCINDYRMSHEEAMRLLA